MTKSVCGPPKKCLGLQKPSVSLSLNTHWFLQPEVMGTSLPGTGALGLGAWCAVENPRSSGGPPQVRYPPFLTATHGCGTSLLYLCPSYQSLCGFCLNSLVVGLHSARFPVVLSDGGSVEFHYFDVVVGGCQYCIYLCCHFD